MEQNMLTVVKAIQILHNAVVVGQKNGVYTFDDSTMIKLALDSLKIRLHLDDKFNEIKDKK